MDVMAWTTVALLVFVWGAVSARLERADLTAPIVFMGAGALLAAVGWMDAPDAPGQFKLLVEITLVWVLFSDAARVRVRDFREDVTTYVRLLFIGLPLTVLLGWGLAAWFFPDLDVWLALLVAAALAPTDAALGVPVVTNKVVPSRIRRLITVESGLNDGIATPVVLVAVAGAASAEGLANAPGPAQAVAELVVGAAVGVAVGGLGGWLLKQARSRHWAAEDFAGMAVLALALAAYTAALAVNGNGFVAAFCGGIAFGAMAGRRAPGELAFLEQASGLVSLLVWLAFGAVALPLVRDRADALTILYAVLSLTLVRMLPVALALLGSGLDLRTVLFVGWFGPRGLASLVFALIAIEELGPETDVPLSVIGITVVLSVLAHGASAAPLAARYGDAESAREMEARGPVPQMPVRGLPRRRNGSDAESAPDPEPGSGPHD